MSLLNFTHLLAQTVTELSEDSSLKGLFHEHQDGDPSLREKSCTKLSNCAVPSFSGILREIHGQPSYHHLSYRCQHRTVVQSADRTDTCRTMLDAKETGDCACDTKREKAIDLAGQFISRLPALREVLATDVEAAYNGDPAAESYGEIISCYPIIKR